MKKKTDYKKKSEPEIILAAELAAVTLRDNVLRTYDVEDSARWFKAFSAKWNAFPNMAVASVEEVSE